MAVHTHGMQLYVQSSGTTYVKVPDLQMLTVSGKTVAQIDTTAYDTGVRTSVNDSVVDYGQFEATFQYESGNAVHTLLKELACTSDSSGGVVSWVLGFSDGNGVKFDAHIFEYTDGDLPVSGEVVKPKITAKIVSAPEAGVTKTLAGIE